ncbi:hypothetical protein [Ruegeria sp. MALMAid1280]|uniref:hypothetical protein n=1 Tax=Ruegeria sp. MALMAid1280 TaxID=3411634 RepID=UPI003B9FBD6E
MTHASVAQSDAGLVAIVDLPLDDFETGLLSVIRHHLDALNCPESQAWHRAYTIATEQWGDAIGFPAAHLLARFLKYVMKLRGGSFDYADPFGEHRKDWLSSDEAALLLVLHHMRRDNTSAARKTVEQLTQGWMDPDVIRSGLTFANRFPAGQMRPLHKDERPKLRVVSSAKPKSACQQDGAG